MFQTPVIPEMTASSRDFHMFDVMFRDSKAGIKNKENFTDEDLEAWKHVFSQEGTQSSKCIHVWTILIGIPGSMTTSS